jgi:[acyl-carrier-protein] S-malonyltransferase
MPDADIEASLDDAERVREDHQVVAVLGSGIGWYAALAFAGVLSLADAHGFVRELAAVSVEHDSATGHLVFPLTDAAWRPDGHLHAALDQVMATMDGDTHESIDLGSYALLTGTAAGIGRLTAMLPAVSVGNQRYPLRLPQRPPLHTPLASPLIDPLHKRVAGMDWRTPQLTLIDGRGVRRTPWSTDLDALRADSFDGLLETSRFATAVRVALREYAPDVLVVPGKGGILATVCGQLIVAEGYQGIRSRRAFLDVQRRRPIVLSMHH